MRRIIRTPRDADRSDPIERASADDLVSLATDIGPVPNQVGALLVLEPGAGFDVERAAALIGDRIRAVPRLRQRLAETPFGCGRPVWVDDPSFEVSAHVTRRACPTPGDEGALLAVAAEVMGDRLPADHPLWRLVIVTGVEGGRVALIVVFHHVLADGIGGLAVLAQLVDGVVVLPDVRWPRPAPGRLALALDATGTRVAALRDLPATWGRLRDEVSSLRHQGVERAKRCSFNVPVGTRRRFAVVRVALGDIHEAAHARQATVNDVVLAAVAGALGDVVRARGEAVDRFVVSVPVSARAETGPTELGNRVGVLPVAVPATGDPLARLAAVAAATSSAKRRPRVGAGLFGAVARVLARLGVFGWFINHQGMINTFVTNLHGPDSRLTLAGAPIVDVVPLTMLAGNVTVAFAVLSYAGELVVTIVADPDAVPEVDGLPQSLGVHLDRLTAAVGVGSSAV